MILFLAVALAAAAQPDPVAAARPAIDKANDEWLPALKAGDADTLVAAYDEKGVFILPDGREIAGKAAIRQMYADGAGPGRKVLGGALHSDGAAAAGPDRVYEWGHADVQVAGPDGTARTQGGAYLTVWQREPDGAWRIVRNLVF
jgi:uncharacterized protein (TIGR02246 family)